MCQVRKLCLAIWLVACFLQTQGASKYYTDENRPYEFGFNIDGEQHRHEKKDENGLIMGEFGFITADGVYHVTVYATDENGNFKIISMKNIRVKPYPTAPSRQGQSLKLPPHDPAHPPPPPPQTQPNKQIKIEPPAKSCSHCSIPTTSTAAPIANNAAPVSQEQQPPFEHSNPSHNNNYPPNHPGSFPQQNPSLDPQNPQNNNIYNSGNPQQNYPHGVNDYNNNYPDNPDFNKQNERNPKQYDIYNREANEEVNPQDVSIYGRVSENGQDENYNRNQKPVLISAQMQIVDKNTDVHHLGPNEREGLPAGLSKDNMETLLYTFNYTVGFHGHHEEGYTSGAKKGYYFITGRNGIRTRVDYVADETGFHPKISQEVLDILSDDVPKPDTEKDEKYGLKGYEFKWLYYPTSSRR